MGAGKSTVGPVLSDELNVEMIDLDEYIEQKYSMSISSIFELYGENRFRDYETNVLKNSTHYQVIATGGGVVERKENVQVMNQGLIIYLEATFSEIDRRLTNDQNRPLWNQSKKEQKKLYNNRIRKYEKIADITINTTNRQIDEIVEEILERINPF